MEMIISCMSWVPVSLAKIFRSFSTETRYVVLPVDIILDIFRRLPVELVFQCCHEDDTLRTLTASQAFNDTHLNQATTLIVYMKDDMYFPPFYSREVVHEAEITVCFVDDKAKKTFLKSVRLFLRDRSPLHLCDSCYGLLLFENWRVCIVWNPITEEQVVLERPRSSTRTGFFFDPKMRDYKVIYLKDSGGRNFHFLIYNLRTQSSSYTSKFSQYPNYETVLIVNGALHWMVKQDPMNKNGSVKYSEAILALDMDSENIRTIAAPAPNHYRRMKKGYLHLFEIEGMLCICDTSPYPCMCIWGLEKYAEGVWIQKHTINLEFLGRPSDWDFDPCYCIGSVKMDNGELVLVWCNISFRYNLKQNKIRQYKLCYSTHAIFSLYRRSLVSLGI